MIIKTTGELETVTLGEGTNAITLTHPQTFDLAGPDSPWDADDLAGAMEHVLASIEAGLIEQERPPDHYKIYRYMTQSVGDRTVAPKDVNYVSGLTVRLHPIHVWNKGRIVETQWHSVFALDDRGESFGSDMVIKESFIYTEDAAGLARHRMQTIVWIREDDSQGETKERPKIYSNAEARTEGRRRRRNVVDQMSMSVVGMLAATQTSGDVSQAISIGQAYMSNLDAQSAEFVELGTTSLAGAILGDSQTTWLNNPISASATIRDFILGELS